MALGGAVICALPTAFRAQSSGGSWLDSMAAAVAVLLCLLAPLALLLPRASRGWRGVVGQTTPRHVTVGLVVWIC